MELQKKSGLLRKLLQFGQGNSDIEAAKKHAKGKKGLQTKYETTSIPLFQRSFFTTEHKGKYKIVIFNRQKR